MSLRTHTLIQKNLPKRIFLLLKDRPIIIILILAAFLRFWSIRHGFPFSYYPDEQHFVNRAVAFGSGDFNPHWFHKPAFYMYLLFFEYGFYFLVGWIFQWWGSLHEFAVHYFSDPVNFYLIGRVTTTAFGLATVYLIYRLGRKVYSESAGLIAALFLAVSYGPIVTGRDVKADTVTVFFTLLSLYFVYQIYLSGSLKDALLGAAFAGVGTATKYYSMVIIIPFMLALLYRIKDEKKPFRHIVKDKRVWISLPFYWGAYFICSPFNFLDPLGRKDSFKFFFLLWDHITKPFRESETGLAFASEPDGFYESFLDYLKVIISPESLGPVLGFLAILGVILVIIRRKPGEIILLSMVFVFAGGSIMASPGYAETRHQLVIYPILLLFAAEVMILFVHRFLSKLVGLGALSPGIVLLGLVLFAAFQPAVSIARYDAFIARGDTRNIAYDWIIRNISADTKIVLDEDGPQLRTNQKVFANLLAAAQGEEKGQFTTHLRDYYNYQREAVKGKMTYEIEEMRFPWWQKEDPILGKHKADTTYDRDMANPTRLVGVESLDIYASRGYKYVITNSFRYTRFLKEGNEHVKNFPAFGHFYKDLFDRGRLVKKFDPDELGMPGPVVTIFRIDDMENVS